LLAPLSAPSGLDRLGSRVFQSSAPLLPEAKAVARWSLLQGGFTRLAVLYPSQTSGQRAMEAFRDQVLALGGDIVALEHYVQGRDTDFRNQVVNLKRAAPQAIFVPGESRELVQIARQIAFYDLQCTLLGTSGWGHPDVIADAGRLVEGVIFADRSETEKDERRAQLFSAQYYDRYGSDPDQYAQLGFDLAAAVWDAVTTTANSREQLCRSLERRGTYQGVSGVLNWQRDDTAEGVRLYTIRDGLIVPLHPRQ
ncbi:penicillin-binding protein activator, partial [Candidatus Fermentibacteria bacterium]|nr:penicillin-binding protein activator [Candidatus Fermentibacteria bacterium]